MIDFDFKEGITVIEGPSTLTTGILFNLCVYSIFSENKDALFIDGKNTFNPYYFLNIQNFLKIKLLPRIHVVRAFTEYQMDALIDGLDEIIEQWNPYALTISYLSSLFSDSDIRLFSSIIEQLIKLDSSMVTVITSHGKSNCDRLLASKADRIINIVKMSNETIRIIDDGYVYEYIFVPSGQMRLYG